MTSKIIVNNIESDVGISSVTFNDTISGDLEGNINSSGTSTFNVISGVSTIGVTTIHVNGINDISYPTIGPLSHRNMCINGAMQVAQRGTSSTGQTTGGYKTVDRFDNGISNVGTWTISQSTDAPAGFSNSLKYECTTASASLNAAAQLYYTQKIEAQNLQQLAYGSSDAKECTFSFYFKTNKTGVYTVEIFQNASSKSISFPMGVSQTGWQRYEFVVPGDTAGTINNDNGVGLWCFLWLAGGSNYTSGTFNNGTWATNVHANRLSSSQVNFADSTSNECFLTGVQLETGSVATPFEHRSFGDELARCRRYYQTSFTSSPGTGNADNTGIVLAGGSTTGNTTTFLGPAHVQLAPSMRAAPTVTIYDLATPRATGNVHRHTYGSAGSNGNVAVVTDINQHSFIVRSDSGISASGIIFHYEVEAEL